MCGIIGCTSATGGAVEILLKGLKRLEYRGYDSAGLAVVQDGALRVVKRAGSIDELIPMVERGYNGVDGYVGIAHTRWATHGRVNDVNAHPHVSCDGLVAIVHNGIVENYEELKEELVKKGHRFASDTDSEVIAHLIEEARRQGVRDHKDLLLRTVSRLSGSYAFLAVSPLFGGYVLAARRNLPLVVGVAKGLSIPSSDVISFLEWTDYAVFLENDSVSLIAPGVVKSWSFDGEPINVKPVKVAVEVSEIDKKDFVHYTLKEIKEQEHTITRSLRLDNEPFRKAATMIKGSKAIYALGAGTSYHAALVSQYLFAEIPGLRVQPILASEYQLFARWVGEGSTIIAISQSGETADVLDAVRDAKKRGARIIGLVNMPNSSLERESDFVLNIGAGPEIGVAATKSFTSQIVVLLRLAFELAGVRPGLSEDRLARLVRQVMMEEEKIKGVATLLREARDIYVVGRGIHYPIALEGALKIKELAYIHAEGMAAGELKHGTLALIEKGTPVILLNPRDKTYKDTLSNGREMKSRGAVIIGLSDSRSDLYDYWIKTPSSNEYETPVLEVIPLQLLAYYTALYRGAEIDKPRNLAKSVTVK